jgi:hypothetical protein
MNYRTPIPPAKLLHELFLYKDGKLFWKKEPKSGRVKAGDRAGSSGKNAYRTVGVDGKYYMEHRLIWRMHHPKGEMPFVLDHIDGDILNNRIENLRAVSQKENQQNRRVRPKREVRPDNKLLQYL